METGAGASRRRACFSFAAYAKSLIEHLRSCEIPVEAGLSEEEFDAVEGEFGFVFPPDLRSILREGLPIGAGFPNWRSPPSSLRQRLGTLVDLPISGICQEVSEGNFWCRRWGPKPKDDREAAALAQRFLMKCPALVPIYRHWYIPALPNLAGNPVFCVRGADCRCAGYDVARFFVDVVFRLDTDGAALVTPAWAAKEARRIDFWSDLADEAGCGRAVCRWQLEDARRMLRTAGWTEEDVTEMIDVGTDARTEPLTKEGVAWHVRLMTLRLRRAGWSDTEVAYALGDLDHAVPGAEGGPTIDLPDLGPTLHTC